MKRLIVNVLFAVIAVSFTACSVDDNPAGGGSNSLADDYFTIVNAVYRDGQLPSATIEDEIDGIRMNLQAISGGTNPINVITTKKYNRFFIGIEGVTGYWDVTPVPGTASDNFAVITADGYLIPIMYSIVLNTNVTIIVCAETEDGEITVLTRFPITFVETKKGDLEINMSFDNEKDVDLHLFTPNGTHIYYASRGGTVQTSEGLLEFGLDKDSNAACNIDGLNNENIFIPEALIEDGTYIVQVDLYSNCMPRTRPTRWAVTARYNNELLNNEVEGMGNPAMGEYATDASSGDHTTVMKFTINRGSKAKARAKFVDWSTYTPYPISDIASMKLEEESWR